MRAPKKIAQSMLEDDLALEVQNKVSKADADALYRSATEAIDFDDLTSALRMSINNGPPAGGYDDSEIRNRVQSLETLSFKHGVDKIGESDLESGLLATINSTLGANNAARITTLETDKADKTQLDNYRLKGIRIAIGDLETTLQNAINYGPANLVSTINDIQTKMRTVDVAIGEADLDVTTKAKLTNAYTMANNSRQKNMPLSISDFDATLQAKLGEAAGVSELTFNAAVNDIYDVCETKNDAAAETMRVNTELGNRRKSDVFITYDDLDASLTTRVQEGKTLNATVPKSGTTSVDLKNAYSNLSLATDAMVVLYEKTVGATNWSSAKYSSFIIPPSGTAMTIANSNSAQDIEVMVQVLPLRLEPIPKTGGTP